MNFTDIKQLLADEDAVSPVIGVILMVAITVILAAVIGTFVLGLGDQVQSSAPNANFQFGYDDFTGSGSMTVTHNGGQDIDPDNVEVKVGSNSAILWSNANSGDTGVNAISTGNSVTYDVSQFGTAPAGGDSVRIIWTSSSGGSSNTIGQSTVPS